jgi:hypothetical protein
MVMKTLKILILLVIMLSSLGCSNNETEPINITLYDKSFDTLSIPVHCQKEEIIKVLQYEKAIVRAVSFSQEDGLDSFGFELINRYDEVQPAPVVPFNEQIPNLYRTDGFPVIISGNIFDCLVVPSLSDTRLSPSNLFELTFIHEQNPGIVTINCEPCADKQTVKVFDNEPAIVRRNNIFRTEGKELSVHIDAVSIDTFAFEIPNRYEGVMPLPIVSRYRVPEEYRTDGLEVKISGEITNCFVGLSAPYIKSMPQNIFELTSIK